MKKNKGERKVNEDNNEGSIHRREERTIQRIKQRRYEEEKKRARSVRK